MKVIHYLLFVGLLLPSIALHSGGVGASSVATVPSEADLAPQAKQTEKENNIIAKQEKPKTLDKNGWGKHENK